MFRYIHNLATSGYWFEQAFEAALSDWKKVNKVAVPAVLDFGCGKKPFERFFRNIECSYKGIDVYRGASVDIIYEGMEIPLADNSIDLVFSVSVFEHVALLDTTLKEIARILKPGGFLIGVVPFMNHVHGVPFDYHRPTRLGWELRLSESFGADAVINVSPVDSRIVCLGNLITAQINFILFDITRSLFFHAEKNSSSKKNLRKGAASPESASGALSIFYFLLKLNPINFAIGLFCWLVGRFSFKRRIEGEITSGYCMVVEKR